MGFDSYSIIRYYIITTDFPCKSICIINKPVKLLVLLKVYDSTTTTNLIKIKINRS